MAKSYQLTSIRRMANRMIRPLVRLGLPPAHYYILGVRGRKSGNLYETPVALVEQTERWLVSPYGEVSWVLNARAAGQVTLSRGGRAETLIVEEVGPNESASVLKTYVNQNTITSPYFDAQPDAPVEAFAGEANRHPVFRLTPARSG